MHEETKKEGKDARQRGSAHHKLNKTVSSLGVFLGYY